MPEYIFEREGGNLNEGNVRKIIKKAGENTGLPAYDPSKYTYAQKGSKKVSATGSGIMAVNPLEHAANADLDLKYTSVMVLSARDSEADFAYSARSVPGFRAPSIGNLLGATQYGVKIEMTQETVEALSAGDYFLYGFKGVQANAGGGKPLVWFKTVDFGLGTDVIWQIQYEAYTSRSQIIPGGEIKGLSSYEIDLGQTLEVASPQGTGDVVTGTDGIISIENLTDTKVTCGISEVVNGTAEPLCAFPLYGNALNAMVPIQKVMLTFATNAVNTGTVVEKAYSQSILIDLTTSTGRKVKFDINKGWDWGGFSWGQAIRPSTNIVPLLIESGS